MPTEVTALECAQLSQQCYNLANNTAILPEGWQSILEWQPSGGWDMFYALYINQAKRQVVLGIRGSAKFFNFLTDAGLVAAAFLGNRNVPPGQRDVSHLGASVQYHLNHGFETGIGIIELEQIGAAIRNVHTNISPSLNNWALALMYTSALTIGLDNVDQLAPISQVAALASQASLQNISIQAIRTCQEEVTRNVAKFIARTNVQGQIEGLRGIQRLFPSFSFTIVGHSLGALMAELVAVELGIPCVSFESPGSLEIMKAVPRYSIRLENAANNGGPDIVHYLSAPNLINSLGSHAGKMYRLFLPHTKGKFSKLHGFLCVFEAAMMASMYANAGAAVGKVVVTQVAATRGASMTGQLFAQGVQAQTVGTNLFIWGQNEEVKALGANLIKDGALLQSIALSKMVTAQVAREAAKKLLTTESILQLTRVSVAAGVEFIGKDFKWLFIQHSIDNITKYLSANEPRMIEMESWPKWANGRQVVKGLGKRTKRFARRMFVPFQKDLPGVRTLFDEEGMIEAQVQRIANYKEKRP